MAETVGSATAMSRLEHADQSQGRSSRRRFREPVTHRILTAPRAAEQPTRSARLFWTSSRRAPRIERMNVDSDTQPRVVDRPTVALTMGDVAGVGPEVIAKGWTDPALHALCRPLVIGSAAVLRRAFDRAGVAVRVQEVDRPEDADPSLKQAPCLDPPGAAQVEDVAPAKVDARAGRAAFDYLNHAIDLALSGRIDAITTLPLNKESLHLAGIDHPGHTEILADRCGTPDHAMMLYLAADRTAAEPCAPRTGRGSRHVAHSFTRRLRRRHHRFGSRQDSPGRPCAPAADGGSTPEDRRLVAQPTRGRERPVRRRGNHDHPTSRRVDSGRGVRRLGAASQRHALHQRAVGRRSTPWSRCTTIRGTSRSRPLGFRRGVNVTLGLPIVRTSVAHGTAFDIAWQGVADPSSLIEAVRVAAQMVAGSRRDR